MIQDIKPKKLDIEYKDLVPLPQDTVFLFDNDNIVSCVEDGCVKYPKFDEFESFLNENKNRQIRFRYLFSIDSERFFIPDIHNEITMQISERYEYRKKNSFQIVNPHYLAFAETTAHQLYSWYLNHKYCGRCGNEAGHAEKERAIVCPKCGLIDYPKISPVVIVGVTDGEKLLMTRYKNRPANQYALVAGFGEIGETLEDTVRREVHEETGVCVKNINYYKSQPWGFSSSLLIGFFCELDGDSTIKIDDNELAEALWMPREEIPQSNTDIALTSDMMEAFRTGSI